MIKRVFFALFSMGISGCWHGPAVNPDYDFRKVGKININVVHDHSNLSGSGEMMQTSLTHNFLKHGFGVTESDFGGPVVNVGNGDQTLELSCIITEFTDSEVIVVPYRHENRGYTKTTVDQSSEADAGNEKAETSASTTTTTHGGDITQGSRIEYTRTRVGIILKMRDADSGSLVWSNSYWYSGLELHRTTEICVQNAIKQVRELFH